MGKKVIFRPYSCGIGRQIQCRENYDTLLELEKMGGRVRDTDDEYKGAEGRDEKTKFMFSPRYNPHHDTNIVIRVWGTTFKPALKKECQRLGVKIYDRVMATSLLTEGGSQGARVIGACGVNNRTGEFMVFKSRASILCMAASGSIWVFNTELAGYPTMYPRTTSSDGFAMAWKAGAELTLMEKSNIVGHATGYKHKWYTGAGDASYENLTLIDDNGKEIPIVAGASWGVGRDRMPEAPSDTPHPKLDSLHDNVLKGNYALPFWGDFPAMPDIERKVTWNLMLGQESTTKIITDTFEKAGFNPDKDLLQNYQFIEGTDVPQWRQSRGGGLVIDWDLKTTLNGLYVAGTRYIPPVTTALPLAPADTLVEKLPPMPSRSAR